MINETHQATATPSLDEHRPICQSCGRGKLDLIDEWPHPVLEPIREEGIQGQGLSLVKRLSMMRIMARRMKATTVLA